MSLLPQNVILKNNKNSKSECSGDASCFCIDCVVIKKDGTRLSILKSINLVESISQKIAKTNYCENVKQKPKSKSKLKQVRLVEVGEVVTNKEHFSEEEEEGVTLTVTPQFCDTDQMTNNCLNETEKMTTKGTKDSAVEQTTATSPSVEAETMPVVTTVEVAAVTTAVVLATTTTTPLAETLATKLIKSTNACCSDSDEDTDRSLTKQQTSTNELNPQATKNLTAGTTAPVATGSSQLWNLPSSCEGDTRTHIVVELFNTEQSYVESLQTVVLKYLNPLKSPENAGIIDAQTVDEIFFMVPAILNIHERFLDELRKRLDAWDTMQKVGDSFVEVFSNLTVVDSYTAFVNNWNKAKDAIRTMRSARPGFGRFLETMAREHKGKLSLDNLLIKPVQKFPNYELILSRLIKHTDVEHPDQKLLQEALKLVHDILMHLNCKERAALENGQREATLRELEGVIEGVADLVTTDRYFLLFDLVTVPSGQAQRKERGLFLFNDLLVITSIKRRSGTIRKPNTTCPGSVASTLDTNKYKFLTKFALDEIDIVKAKDDNLRKIMNEIETLASDSIILQQVAELTATMKTLHSTLDGSIRDLQQDLQRQLTERQTNDTQLLSVIDLMVLTNESICRTGIQNLSILFNKPERRNQWEETFNEAKQKLAASVERQPILEFLTPLAIRKTRAGLQFTCAAPTLGGQKDVWVCNSDGYVGQVCVLSLSDPPTVTSCNGVCNARILCVASVPANAETSNTSVALSDEGAQSELCEKQRPPSLSCIRQKSMRNNADTGSEGSTGSGVQLDSASSGEESESELNCNSNIERPPSPSSQLPTVLPQPPIQEPQPSQQQPITSSSASTASATEDTDSHQSTMWLGTEDGCIHVYNCTDNIRIKKNKIKIQHINAVYSILYLDNRVFVSLANGDICVYLRDQYGWNTTSPLNISIGTVTSPVTKLLNVYGKLWCAIQGIIKVLNTNTLSIENQIQISTDSKPITNMTVANNTVWISVQNSAHIKCFHSNSYELICEVNLAPSVNKMLSNCDDIIRQHKAACLRVTSLMACRDLIWIGTSAGVLLTIPTQQINKDSQPISSPIVTGIPHGHTGHVRFLTFVETNHLNDVNNVLVAGQHHKQQSGGGVNNRNSITSHLSNLSISSNNNNNNNNNNFNLINNNMNNINNNNINLNLNNINNNIINNNNNNNNNNANIGNNNATSNSNTNHNNNNINNNNNNNASSLGDNKGIKKLEQRKILIISGGDGYENFTKSNSVSEGAGREDSTNHLLLWKV